MVLFFGLVFSVASPLLWKIFCRRPWKLRSPTSHQLLWIKFYNGAMFLRPMIWVC